MPRRPQAGPPIRKPLSPGRTARDRYELIGSKSASWRAAPSTDLLAMSLGSLLYPAVTRAAATCTDCA